MVAHETLVLELTSAQQESLRRALENESLEPRSVEHARFSLRGNGFIATLYRSGKLVVQGSQVAWFKERFLGEVAAAPAEERGPITVGERVLVGSDEAGKGDYFGPLVVVAVRASPKERAELVKAGVADSKTLSDERVRVLAPALESRYAFASEVLMPEEYNRVYATFPSLNPMLAELHARVIRRLAQPGELVLVDKFADERLVASRLAGLELELHQRTKAEREPVVAAASVIARNLFLEGLKRLSEESAVELHKGAGEPTDHSAREFVRLHGAAALARVAKMHFKNTQKVRV
jgi:ribonuclease HIII